MIFVQVTEEQAKEIKRDICKERRLVCLPLPLAINEKIPKNKKDQRNRRNPEKRKREILSEKKKFLVDFEIAII